MKQFWMKVLGVTLLALSISSSVSSQVKPSPPQISGVVVHKDLSQNPARTIFSVVANRSNALFFKNFLRHLPEPGSHAKFPPRALQVSLNGGVSNGATDLEDIDVLGGKVVAISEGASRLVSEHGAVVDYFGIQELREVDNKYGMEGLAVRPLSAENHRVAVLFEGGEDDKKGPRSPRLFVHDVHSKYLSPDKVLRPKLSDGDFAKIKYNSLCAATGEDHPTIFRAPALVWTRLPGNKWGFIVLVSVDDKARYHQKWLVRCDESGRLIGKALALTDLGMTNGLASRNWEGMAWGVDRSTLVFVDDAKQDTALFVAKRPDGW